MDEFYEIKENMTKEHQQHLKDLKVAYDKSVAELKRQSDAYDKLVADRSKELLDIEQKKKTVLSDIEKSRLVITNLTKEMEGLEKRKISLTIFLEGEERAFQDRIALFEKDKKKIADERIAEKAQNAKIRAEAEAMIMAAEAREKSSQKVLDEAKKILREAEQLKTEADKRNEETKNIHADVVSKLTLIENSKVNIAMCEKALAEVAEREKKVANTETTQNTRENNLNAIASAQDEKAIQLELWEAEIKKREEKVASLIQIHKLKGKA